MEQTTLDFSSEEYFSNLDIEDSNSEIIDDLKIKNRNSTLDLVIYARDWTVETIFSQITQGNINLDPEFQRRNAWSDIKRNLLIESIIAGYPIPEIVLAEDSKNKGAFIVIDGKQRLLTLAGFFSPTEFKYWNNNRLQTSLFPELNGLSWNEIEGNEEFRSYKKRILNGTIRCATIINITETDILYDIFHRLNSTSVALSTQELRQVIFRGEFTRFLNDRTSVRNPLHHVMGISDSDNRFRDVEILLRLISLILNPKSYSGNLKLFLDQNLDSFNSNWANERVRVESACERIFLAINKLSLLLGDYKQIARKYVNGQMETRFNRALLDVSIYFFSNESIIEIPNIEQFADKFRPMYISLLSDDYAFKASIESSTKTRESYQIRFNKFSKLINDCFSVKIESPFLTHV